MPVGSWCRERSEALQRASLEPRVSLRSPPPGDVSCTRDERKQLLCHRDRRSSMAMRQQWYSRVTRRREISWAEARNIESCNFPAASRPVQPTRRSPRPAQTFRAPMKRSSRRVRSHRSRHRATGDPCWLPCASGRGHGGSRGAPAARPATPFVLQVGGCVCRVSLESGRGSLVAWAALVAAGPAQIAERDRRSRRGCGPVPAGADRRRRSIVGGKVQRDRVLRMEVGTAARNKMRHDPVQIIDC